jgi:hypothetical protein
MPVSAPIHTLKGDWQKIAANDRLKRSSQIASVINGALHIFGGEVQPRQPVDDKVDVVALSTGSIAPPPPSRYSAPPPPPY